MVLSHSFAPSVDFAAVTHKEWIKAMTALDLEPHTMISAFVTEQGSPRTMPIRTLISMVYPTCSKRQLDIASSFFHRSPTFKEQVWSPYEPSPGFFERLSVLFFNFDTNNDGVLSFEELRDGLSHLGWSDEEVEAAMQVHDTNGDGVLQMDEFEQMYRETMEQVTLADKQGKGPRQA
jgi:tape measure domain-containing protein